jgi:hypothetical protein
MNKGATFVIACIFLAWFFSSSPKQQPEPIPTDGLVEAVASVKESMASNHISDAGKKVELSGNSGRLNSSVIPNSSPSPSDRHEKIKREILVFVSKNCPPCERWKKCEMQKFLDAGWSVGIVEDHSYGITPTFEIESEGKKATRKGYTTLEQAAEAVR